MYGALCLAESSHTKHLAHLVYTCQCSCMCVLSDHDSVSHSDVPPPPPKKPPRAEPSAPLGGSPVPDFLLFFLGILSRIREQALGRA